MEIAFVIIFYLCLYKYKDTNFYTFTLQVQTHPDFSLPFLKVILFLESYGYFLKF